MRDIFSIIVGIFSSASDKEKKSKGSALKQDLADKNIVDFFQESKNDKPRPKTSLYIKDNGVDDPDVDLAGADRSALDPQLKLQKYFRQAFQYRMVNSLEGTRLQFYADIIAGLTLTFSVVISILLLAGLSDTIVTAAAILSAIVTFLTGFSSYMGFQDRYEKHCMSSTQFATVQRDIYTILQTETDKGIADEITMLTTDFNNAREQMPIIQDDIIKGYLDEKGITLFPGKYICICLVFCFLCIFYSDLVLHSYSYPALTLIFLKTQTHTDIVEEMQWNESIEVVQDISRMKMSTKTSPNPNNNKLHIETMLRKRRRYQRMNQLKLQPRKRVVKYETGIL